jgi:hypothetical protein
MNKELNKFLLSQSISSTFQLDYFNKIQRKNTTSHLIESNGLPIDIFSKLLDERIIFLINFFIVFLNWHLTHYPSM